ncbi:thiol:disulfide interchange protein DsbC precursor [mine drainage metagenome]|uniref:Thiol:disulfide interchange protein DsbC n=1 Tax=mine drainage metagenome TaxID=410659 RepID=A0A1J5SPU5_9ZZZZ
MKKALKITNILVSAAAAEKIFALIGMPSANELVISIKDVDRFGSELVSAPDGCSFEEIEPDSLSADMARRVTALINTRAGYRLESIKPLGSPHEGVLIPLVGQYDEISSKAIRAALKWISKNNLFAIPVEDLLEPREQMLVRMKRNHAGSNHSTAVPAIKSNFREKLSGQKFGALNKYAVIIGRLALYGFAAFGVFSTIAMLTHPSDPDAARAAANDAASYRQAEAMLAQAQAQPPQQAITQQTPPLPPPREIEIVTGKADAPQHRFYVFSDPVCPWCKKFEPLLEKVASREGFEMHLFPTPLHGEARALVSQIACAKNRGRAWHESITNEKVTGGESCSVGEAAPSRAVNFFNSLNLREAGTPTVINEAGVVHPGGFDSEKEMIQFLEQQN